MLALLKVVVSVVVLSAAESDPGDVQTHAMLQVNSRGEAVKYDDVRAESEHEADESADEEDDGLQVAHAAGTKYVISDAHMEAGKKLWNSQYGPLFTKYVGAMVKLGQYWARVIQRAGQNMGNITDAELERPNQTRMAEILQNWTTELRTVNHTFPFCDDDVLRMETCMGLTRCLIEPLVGVDGGIGVDVFAAMIEVEVVTSTVLMRDFIAYFNGSGGAHAHPCEDQLSTSSALLSQELSEQATSAVATAAKVQTASNRMAQLLTPSNTSVLALLQPADLESVWHEPCAALGCNTGSWIDIMDSLHGHAEELVKVQAPAHAIRLHIVAMRSAQHAVQQAARTSTAFLANFETHLSRGVLKKTRATTAYDSRFKEAGGIMDGAIAAWGWGNPFRRLQWCWGVSLDKVIGYVKKLPAASNWAMILSMTFKNWNVLNWRNLFDLMSGDKTCLSTQIKLQFCVLIGFCPGEPEALGVGAGLAIAAQFRYSNCNNNLNLDIGVSAQGAVFAGSTSCVFGQTLGGVFNCANGYSIGVNTICCKINLLKGNNDCD